MTDDLQQIQVDIARARTWAKRHFNAYVDEETTPSNPFFAKPTFDVSFPEPDIMQVWPITFEQPMIVATAEYRLCWKPDGLYWKGGLCLRPDITNELKVD